MESEPSREAVLTDTGFQISLQQDNKCKESVDTNVDSANPFRLLLGTECSPFSPYRWFRTRPRVIRTGHAERRPENDQCDRNNTNFVDGHVWERYGVKWGRAFGTIYRVAVARCADRKSKSGCLYVFRRLRA